MKMNEELERVRQIVNRERINLLSKKYTDGLSGSELKRLEYLTKEVAGFWPSVTPFMKDKLNEMTKVSDKMKNFAELLSEPVGEFDIILYNHNNTYYETLKSECKIYTIHGIFPSLEKPVLGLDAYVAISNEIKEHHNKLNPIYIPNGINVEKYYDYNKRHYIKRLLFLSNYKNNFSKLLRCVTLSLGMNYKRVGGNSEKAKFEIVDDLNWADIVVGVGRSALETMSCGKKVIVADKRNYADYGMDGLLTEDIVAKSSNNNFTGRALKKHISFFSLRKEIKSALLDSSKWEREYIIKNHNIVKIAESYLSLANKIIKNKEPIQLKN